MERYYSVKQLSGMLKIHPKTIQRYIREGKLRAAKVGKSWRVTGHDVSVFLENEKNLRPMEGQRRKPPLEERCKASAVVDMAVCHQEDAIRIMNALTGALNGKPPEYGSSSMHTHYIPEENKIRVTLWGGVRFMEVMMGAIATLTEQIEE